MAQHDDQHAHAHNDAHAHPAHGGHDHAHVPYDEERVTQEIVADRQWMFDMFIRITFWHVVGITVVLILLAATQT